MPNENDLSQEIKRLSYWTKETEYVPPKRIVKHPSEVTVDDLLAFDLKAFVDYHQKN